VSRLPALPVLDVGMVFAARREPPSSRRLQLARLISVLVVVAGARYLWERASTISGTGAFGVVFYVVECLAFVLLVVSALLLARASGRGRAAAGKPAGTLDVFVTVCGEPPEMVEETLLAALAIDYPHRTYLLNDGRLAGMDGWAEIERLAERYGVTCFTRTDGLRGKAGNLNHALGRTSGDFVVTIDADHLAAPDLATETLGYFADDRIAFVCTSQLFQTTGGDVLNNREPLFYRFLQPAKDADSSAFSCGNGTVYRRTALASVSGFSEWNLVEDLHTSYVLHAAGWKSVYHAAPVTVGSAPQTASVFLRQRLRWATDSTRLLTRDSPLFKAGLSPMQRMHYLHTTSYYFLAGLQLCFLIGPPLTVFLGLPIFNTGATVPYLLAAIPYFVAILLFLSVHGDRNSSLPIVQSALFSAPVYIVAAVRAIFGLRPDSRPTEKERQPWFSPLLVPQICVFAALGGTIVFAAFRDDPTSIVAISWASVMAFLLAGPLSAVNARPALERLLRGSIRAGIVLIAVFAIASQLATRSVASSSCAAPPSARSAAAALPVPPTGAYFGISQPDLPVCAGAIRSWAHGYGFHPAIVNWFQQWRSGETKFRSDWLRTVAQQGAVPMVTWEPWTKPLRGYHDAVQPTSRLARIVSGRDDAYIRSWARAAARYGGPLLLRPMQEMNGTWYPWAVATNGNDAKEFVAAWRHIHRIFDSAGATNVEWVWTVHALPGVAPRFGAFYPGGDVVDWVSLTTFNWGTAVGWGRWENIDELMAPTYDALLPFGKPVMVSEVGTVVQGGDAPDWVATTMRRIEAGYPRVKAVVWFSYRYSQQADFRVRGPSVAALRAALDDFYWQSAIGPGREGEKTRTSGADGSATRAEGG
jgi:cellulose synthase (UDP-forming)